MSTKISIQSLVSTNEVSSSTVLSVELKQNKLLDQIKKNQEEIRKKSKSLASKSKSSESNNESSLLKPRGFKNNIINYVHPHYPRAAQKRAIEGEVRLKIYIAKDGSVDKVIIVQPSQFKPFNESVLSAVKKWIFKPHSSSYSVEKTVYFQFG